MNGRTVRLLLAKADKDNVSPIIDALREKGITAIEGTPEKGDTLLAVLSKNFYEDSSLKDALLSATAFNGESVLPLQIDKEKMPEDLRNAIYARNILSAVGREPGLVADRIIEALPAKKSRLPILLAAGGVVLLAIFVFLFAKGMQGSTNNAEETAAEEVLQEPEIPYPLPAGLTEKELAEISCVVIIGEHFKYYTNADRLTSATISFSWGQMLYELANESGEGNPADRRWYWNEDGSEVTRTSYDLRFLSLMPNLEDLQMAEVDVADAPDLSGLNKLIAMSAMDCDLGEISWITNTGIQRIQLRCDTDYSVLGKCTNLQQVTLDTTGTRPLDFSYFSPTTLKKLTLNASGREGYVDLSGLSKCEKLEEVSLTAVPVRSLAFLEGKNSIEELELRRLENLEDISVIGSLSSLRELTIDNCSSVQDYSTIGKCSALERLTIMSGDRRRLRDASFVGGLKKLIDINLSGADLSDLDFLKECADGRDEISRFSFVGSVGDYSGLGAFRKYTSLTLDPDNAQDFDRIASCMENIEVDYLTLRRLDRVELSMLPKLSMQLILERCGITDLSTMPEDWKAPYLTLQNCMVLRSLEGLQNQSVIGNNRGVLTIYNCPRLSDFDALSGMRLSKLEITGGFTLPSMADVRTSELNLDSVEEVKDLSFLEGMDNSNECSFKLVGLEVNNLKPLERFKGLTITVSPELEEQALDLVKAGNFVKYQIEYPQGGWELDRSGFSLLSLDELETLPDAMLRHVKRIAIAGDMVIDSESCEIRERWDNGSGSPKIVVYDHNTNEETTIEPGPVTDIRFLEKLTGLQSLELYLQPLESLEGIQNFRELASLNIVRCYELTDFSSVFTLQDLQRLSLRGSNADSIQGVQNLTILRELDIMGTKVSDLSPLTECDFSEAAGDGGFSLRLDGNMIEDFSPLASIPVYNSLEIHNTDAERFLSFLEGKEIRWFLAGNAFTKESSAEDLNALFAEFVEGHQGLRELHLQDNNGITDLTPLLSLEGLEFVKVTSNMEKAIESLEGQDVRFYLEIEQRW